MIRSTLLNLSIGAVVVVAIAACGPAAGSDPGLRTVDQERATEMAQDALQALNDGDYAGYSEHWSDEMKAAIKEADFLAFRDQVMANLGEYVSIEDVELTSVAEGTYRYVFTVAFERGEADLAFGFHEGSNQVQGVFAL